MSTPIGNLVEKYERDGDFTHVAPTPEMIDSAQDMLCLTVPQQFVEYLNAYGHGGIGGVEILGVGLTGTMLFLETTLRYRKYGLPHNLLAVENVDEWLYCIDCDTGSVVSWSQTDGIRPEFSSFDEFVISEFNDAIENL